MEQTLFIVSYEKDVRALAHQKVGIYTSVHIDQWFPDGTHVPIHSRCSYEVHQGDVMSGMFSFLKQKKGAA